MPINIFGYGSLLNETSRRHTFTELDMVGDVVLRGYQRILNATHDSYDFLAMNLTVNESMSVKGHVFTVSDEEFPALLAREVGYDLVAITNQLSVQLTEPVFAFVMPAPDTKGKIIKQSYLEKCLGGVPEEEHDTWLQETIVEHDIDLHR